MQWGSSAQAGDLRQAQLTAIAEGNVGLSTAIDTGDWTNIHPPDKQNPSRRLAHQALQQIYGMDVPGADFPVYTGSTVTSHIVDAVSGGTVRVTVNISAGGKPVQLTDAAPVAATQSSTLGVPGSTPRNVCIDAKNNNTGPADCGYPMIVGLMNGANARLSLNATVSIGPDGSSLVLEAAGAPADFAPFASSYGRGSWPLTTFFSADGDKLPVLPWFANFTSTNFWTPPSWSEP